MLEYWSVGVTGVSGFSVQVSAFILYFHFSRNLNLPGNSPEPGPVRLDSLLIICIHQETLFPLPWREGICRVSGWTLTRENFCY